jgi:predicted TIM-barrel fold metal-dependent hydrolase
MREMLCPRPSWLPADQAVIDADLHNVVPSVEALRRYMSQAGREYVEAAVPTGATDASYPPNAPTSAVPGSWPEGGPPGSSLRLLQEQALDPWGVERAILCCLYGASNVRDPDAAAILASACNDWQVAEWLERDERLRASVVVDVKQPRAAAREIERVGGHPGFVQVILPVRSETLYGNRELHPIYEAAVRHDLALALHFGGSPGTAPTPTGWPSYYVEEYVGMNQIFESQIMNLIAEGVFDRFPTARFAMVEGGWAWVPAWMWRMDKEWKGLRREIPWVRDAPSEYIRRHMRFTLQPVDAPNALEMLRIVEHMGSDELLMFSTDYPHRHFERPEEAMPGDLPEELRRKILARNARAFYRL